MAHRIAELLEREQIAETVENRETVRQECADLILRLWHQRREWPDKSPLASTLARLKGIQPKPEYERQNKVPETWLEILPALDEINTEEEYLCWQAAIMELDPSELAEEIAQAEKYGENLDQEEQDLVTVLLALKKQREEQADLSRLGKEELTRHFAERLKSVARKRANLFGKVFSAPLVDDETNDSDAVVTVIDIG